MSTTLSNPQVNVQLRCQLTTGGPPAVVTSQVSHQPNITLGAGNSGGNVDRCFSESFTVSCWVAADGEPFIRSLIRWETPWGSCMLRACSLKMIAARRARISPLGAARIRCWGPIRGQPRRTAGRFW